MEYPAKTPQIVKGIAGRTHPAGPHSQDRGNFFTRRIPLAVRRTAARLEKFFRRFAAMLVTTVKEFIKDDCLNLAAQISYYTLFSIFPLILGVILLITSFYDDPVARDTLLRQLTAAFPSGTINVAEIVNETLQKTQSYRPIFLVIFFLGLIWGGTGVFDSITNSLNKAWQIPGQQRGIIESLIIRFVLFGLFIAMLIGSVGLTIAYDLARNFSNSNSELRYYLKDNPIWEWISFCIPWTLNLITFMLLYRIVPQRKVTFRDVWPGAVFATVIFEVVKIGFNFYVTKIASYAATYGSLAGVIIFIFWIYLIALVGLFGGELSSVYAEMRGAKRPTKLARQGKLAQADPLPPQPVASESDAARGDHSLDYAYECEEVFCVYVSKEFPTVPAASEACKVEQKTQ